MQTGRGHEQNVRCVPSRLTWAECRGLLALCRGLFALLSASVDVYHAADELLMRGDSKQFQWLFHRQNGPLFMAALCWPGQHGQTAKRLSMLLGLWAQLCCWLSLQGVTTSTPCVCLAARCAQLVLWSCSSQSALVLTCGSATGTCNSQWQLLQHACDVSSAVTSTAANGRQGQHKQPPVSLQQVVND